MKCCLSLCCPQPEFPSSSSGLPHRQQQLPEREEPMVLPRVRVPLTLQLGAIRASATSFGYLAQNRRVFVNSVFYSSNETIQAGMTNTFFCPAKFLTHTIILPNSKYNLYKEDSLFFVILRLLLCRTLCFCKTCHSSEKYPSAEMREG